MNKVYIPQETIILPKEISKSSLIEDRALQEDQGFDTLYKGICQVPYSNEVDYATFAGVLNDTVASYKMYWLLAILDEVSYDKKEIEFRELVSRMVVKAWYPILKCKLSFGLCDNLAKVVNYISDTYNIGSNYNEAKLLELIYNTEDKNIRKMLKDLTYNVPYRFLAPFFKGKLIGRKVEKQIEELSKQDNNCVYEIYVNEKNENSIRIRDNWCNYLKYNGKIIEGWAYYELTCFLQKRNPNVPGIAMKLEAPKNREALREQTKIWREVINHKHIKDLYTGLAFTANNYEEYGVLSIDHFIPWSFVLHDQMWNLVPTFKNINSKKSDNLLPYDSYIDKFCEIQYEAFDYVVNENRKNQIDEYREVLKIQNAKRFIAEKRKEEFVKKLRQEIGPVYGVAVNQGFGVLEKFI
ncbi:MAG: HNH endonuclease [Clostridium beijerinckii]|nr:HNH endonuclease [Clostridium beijerinckii]